MIRSGQPAMTRSGPGAATLRRPPVAPPPFPRIPVRFTRPARPNDPGYLICALICCASPCPGLIDC